MTEGTRYLVQRRAFAYLCYMLICASLIRSCASCNPLPHPQATNTQPQVASYNPGRLCENAWQSDVHHENDKINHFTVDLTEGCFGGYVHFPKTWTGQWWTQPADPNVSDYWVAYWFSGGQPDGPYTVNHGGALRYTSNEVRLQGHGKIMFYTNTKGNDVAPVRAPQGREEAVPKTSTDSKDAFPNSSKEFVVKIDSCTRVGAEIDCGALATNRTDIPVYMVLRGGHSTDDLGYLVTISDWLNMIFSDGQDRANLLPDTPTRFTFTIRDPHPDVKLVNIQIKIRWKDKYVDLAYPKVPVQ